MNFKSLPLLLLVFVSLGASATPERPVLRWCLDHFPSFHEFHGRQAPTGPSVDLMQELAKRVGFDIEFSPRTPPARCFRQMGNGEADLMSNLNFTEERAQIMHLFPYNENIPESLYLRAQDQRLIDQVSQLTPLFLVTVRNYTYNKTLMAIMQNQSERHLEVDSIAAGFDLLLKGRVDGLIVPTHSSLEVIRKNPELHFKFRKAALDFRFGDVRYINIGFSKTSKHAALKDKIGLAIQGMIQDGTVKRLYALETSRLAETYLAK